MHLVALMRFQDRPLGTTLLALGNQGSVMATKCMTGDWMKATKCLPLFLQRLSDRAPPARRIAGKPAPTFVSGQLFL
ncbi:hypothetical protein [Pseudomonas sichuanensis]|uniref:Uncharacterized protein n=1 Tax=Pseudomonas sichuanensis TaxID=2213015 RepID=A0ABV0DC96_9PSED